MRPANPLILSIGIHFALIALLAGAISIAVKTMPIPPGKIKLKILMQPPESTLTRPIIRPSQPIAQKTDPTPTAKPKAASVIPSPQIQVKTKEKPSATPPPRVAEPFIPTVAPKIPETLPIVTQKAPPPKVEENYAEENLGQIRIILAERLKYPKNALRLNQQGETTVSFTLGTDREVSQITIAQSSGFEFLDNAAKKLIEMSAAEFPKPAKPVRISVPIEYKLR